MAHPHLPHLPHPDLRRPAGARIVGALSLAVVAVVALVFFFMFLAGWRSVPPDKVLLHYSGGPVQGTHFKSVVAPGTHTKFYGLLERYYYLPSTQRNYIISHNADEGDRKRADSIQSPSKDGVVFDFQVAVYFKLNTHQAVVRRFLEQICLKYGCTDLSPDGGWDRMLNDNFRQQIENAIQTESRKYGTDDLANNGDTLRQIQSDVGSNLKERINTVLGDEYFCGPTFDPSKPACPDFTFVLKKVEAPQNIRDNYAAVKASQIAIQQKQNEVAQAQQQAAAAAALNAAISNNPNYVLLKAIESGKITFWVLPSGNNFTLQTPPTSAP